MTAFGGDDDLDGERRRNERYPVALHVDYDDADDLIGDYTENLSNGGTCVASGRMLAVGAAVRLTLSFPGLVRPLVLDGVVRWCNPQESLLGIQFVDSHHEQLAILVARIRDGDTALLKRTLRLLVVEDNRNIADLLREGLGFKSGFGPSLAVDCRLASDGREALELVRKHRFDALIVDVYLPVVDGATLIKTIRNELALSSLPILAVSCGGEDAERVAMRAGANTFIDKPMRLRSLLDKIRELVPIEPRG